MMKLDLDNKRLEELVIGKVSFNKSHLKGMKKDEFINTFSSAFRGQDIKEIWKQVSPHTKLDKVAKAKK